MSDTKQINATVKTSIVNKIEDMAKEEIRSFSLMVAILLEEAVIKREKPKTK